MKIFTFCTVLFLNSSLLFAQFTPIDLNTWKQEGPLGAGTWNVSADGFSVLQTINGNPTFFVSPDTLINTRFHGEIKVETGSDDDYIGLVFGYNAPFSDRNDDPNYYDFLLFDWKQNTQNFNGFLAREGFSLNRVNGTFTDYLPHFWEHQSADTFKVLYRNYADTLGWSDNILHSIDILYEKNKITIWVDEKVVIDTIGIFPEGRFGFYNYSQAQVRYQGFSVNRYPVANVDSVFVNEDSSVVFMPLKNDTDADNNSISIVEYNNPLYGNLSSINDSIFAYTPNLNFFGADSFFYIISDGLGGTDTGCVSIIVNPVNDPPFPISLISPENDSEIDSLSSQLTFKWTASADVDGDNILYDLYIFEDQPPFGKTTDTLLTALNDSVYLFEGNNFFKSERIYSWWVKVYDAFDTLASDTFSFKTPFVTNISDFKTIPSEYKLYPNVPNPFNSSTKISYDLKETIKIKLTIYNIIGQEIAILLNEEQTPGRKSVIWDGRDKFGRNVSSGIYFYTFEAGHFNQTKKLVLVK